jgi:hypothetical protein
MAGQETFFAPQARLMTPDGATQLATLNFTFQLPSKTQASVTVSDLSSVKVTLVSTGVSQCSIVLNNHRRTPPPPGPPQFPPWKYNDLKQFSFGQRVRIDFRYGGDPNGKWQVMMHARITDMTFTFPSSGGAQLTLEGEDLLSLLKHAPEEDPDPYKQVNEDEVVTKALATSETGLRLADPLVPRAQFKEKLTSLTHQKKTSYLQFFQSMADRLDYEVFVDNQVNTDSDVKLHFEPARSLNYLQQGSPRQLTDVYTLEWGRHISDFNPKFKVWDQYTGMTAKGAHPTRAEEIDANADASEIDKDIRSTGTTLNAAQVRAQYFQGPGDAQTNDPGVETKNLDAERAQLQAAAALRKKARQLLTVDCKTFGIPDLLPGKHVQIQGLRAPFDGIYYVTSAVHSIDANGYRTGLSLRRPWMLPPSDYPSPGVSA